MRAQTRSHGNRGRKGRDRRNTAGTSEVIMINMLHTLKNVLNKPMNAAAHARQLRARRTSTRAIDREEECSCSQANTAPTNSSAPSPRQCLGSSATNPAVPQQKPQSGGIVLTVICRARATGGFVTRQGVALTDLQSLLDCKIVNKTSLSLSLSLMSCN